MKNLNLKMIAKFFNSNFDKNSILNLKNNKTKIYSQENLKVKL